MLETSFFELRTKSVINVIDGKNLGNICDVIMEICTGKILGFVVPGKKKWFQIFSSCDNIFIPYHNICKIGVDSILVELNHTEIRDFKTNSFSDVTIIDKCPPSPPPPKNDYLKCGNYSQMVYCPCKKPFKSFKLLVIECNT